MAARIRVTWQNFPGAPGFSNFYTLNAPSDAERGFLRTFFSAVVSLLPSGCTIQVPSSGDLFDPTSGAITGGWTGSAVASVVGSGSGAYAGNAGAVVNWRTNTIISGRRVQGRTFLVPLTTAAFDTQGSLGTTPLQTISNAAGQLITDLAGSLYVWHRPGLGSGSLAQITASSVPDMAASLRSRRT